MRAAQLADALGAAIDNGVSAGFDYRSSTDKSVAVVLGQVQPGDSLLVQGAAYPVLTLPDNNLAVETVTEQALDALQHDTSQWFTTDHGNTLIDMRILRDKLRAMATSHPAEMYVEPDAPQNERPRRGYEFL